MLRETCGHCKGRGNRTEGCSSGQILHNGPLILMQNTRTHTGGKIKAFRLYLTIYAETVRLTRTGCADPGLATAFKPAAGLSLITEYMSC